jgi:acyl-CoA dehydrogenase
MTPELASLQELAGDIFRAATAAGLDVPRRGIDFDAALWDTAHTAGLTLLTASEANGGSGAGVRELAVVLDRAGYHAAPIPLADNDILAAWLLDTAGVAGHGGPMVAASTQRELDGNQLTVTLEDVPWASVAQTLVVVGPDFVAALRHAQFDAAAGRDLAGQPFGREAIDTTLESSQSSSHATDLTSEFTARGAWARSVQTCGALARALELSCTHVTQREQFGRPLAAFQPVPDLTAAAAGALSVARASAEFATDVVDRAGFASPAAEFAIAVAKIQSARAATVVARNAHQAHGAIGFTLDHELRHFTTRALAWRYEFGVQRHGQRRLGQMVLDGESAVWDLVTAVASP